MEFKTSKFNFKYGEKSHSLRFPSVGEVKKFVKNSDNKENDPIDVIIEFVVNLGISQEDCEEIQIDHLKEILSYLTGEKKS